MRLRSVARASCWLMVVLAGTPVAYGQITALNEGNPPESRRGEVPLRAVTLYRSGVGSFERSGTVENDTTMMLEFESDRINDVLKSMVVVDQSGGSVGAISYASKEPLSRRLASLGIDISGDPSLADLLSRLRGAPVRFNTPEGVISGSVLSVEKRDRKDGLPQPVANVLTGSGVRSVYLWETLGFEILDESLAADLERALSMLAQERQDNVKDVNVELIGDGRRRVMLSYVHEMPVWKTSYRLVLPRSEGASEGGNQAGAFLQGWAIVENTTDEDWDNIRLSLVSGQQVSFTMDLYEPVYTDRPEVPVPLGLQASAIEYEDAFGGAYGKAAGQNPFRNYELSEGAPPPGRPATGGERMSRMRADPTIESDSARLIIDAMDAAGGAAEASSAGEVFQYTLKDPISIQRRRSAMLPIIGTRIEAERVSILSQGMAHPMRGARLVVPENIQLIPGAISVYDEAAFAGDARIGFVSGGDDRLISYATDLDVLAETDSSYSAVVTKVKVVAGTLEVTTSQTAKTTYTITNNDRHAGRALLVEHPRMDGWDLREPKGDVETTDSVYRFKVALAPNKGETLVVSVERPSSSSYSILDYGADQLRVLVSGGHAPKEIVDAYREAARLRSLVTETETRLGALRSERETIAKEQARIRENIGSIDRQSELYARYMRTLTSQEDRLDAITGETDGANKELAQRREALTKYLQSINIG